MSQLWTIVALADGSVLCPAFVTDAFGQHPKDKGWAWDGSKQRAVRIDAVPDPLIQRFDGVRWSDDPAKLEPLLVAPVKVEAERRKMAVRSPGSGKVAEYREKRAEAYAGANVVASVLDALTMPAAVQQYPAAAMEAQLTGEKLSAVLKRYLAAANAADMEVYRLSAIEQRGTAAIKAGATAAAKRAAAAAIDWDWRPAA